MVIDTETRTRPKMRLYYAIMLGGFAISMGALILLNWTAFVLIALVSTVAVIIAAVRLGVAGPQVVVDDDAGQPIAPLPWKQLSTKQRLIQLAILAGGGAILMAFFLLPDQGADRVRLALDYVIPGYAAYLLLREFRRSWAMRAEHRPIPLAIRFSILILAMLALAGILYLLIIEGGGGHSSDITLGLLIFLALRYLGTGRAFAAAQPGK